VADSQKNTSAFTDAERDAMKERAREAREFKKLSGEEQVSRKIAEMTPAEQKMATAIHTLSAPSSVTEMMTVHGLGTGGG